MDRTTLARRLNQDTEAFLACRRAVDAGAEFNLYPEDVELRNLITTYRRREQHTRESRIPTIGFTEALADLEQCGHGSVLLGAVYQADPPYHYQLFLAPDESRVVACLGVSQARQAHAITD